ncbi:hypothetical protein BD626DRAFT_569282 [Schizophyllum amplum]|uniref:Uncharacterized protein n=1 Tax=Schizophyllum amplum TaxID=97359 RepID=A0A550CEM9_9AGAR|nr:hypothetical protein BD626DRAFT_569282 [Auriculariopsis ampla]
MVNLRKRYREDDGTGQVRVKRRETSSPSPNNGEIVSLSEDMQPKFKPRPDWYYRDELTFCTAASHPQYSTPSDIVHFLKTKAISAEYHKTKPRALSRLILRLPNGESAVLPVVYRAPVIFLSHFLWGSMWSVITRGELWQDHMHSLLHIARLLYKLRKAATNGAPLHDPAAGKDISSWRYAPFDRAVQRMTSDGFLLPVDGDYGDRYNKAFWERYQDTRYKEGIEHRPWMEKIFAGKFEGFPRLDAKEELYSFDAAAYAECLQMSPTGPVWEPVSAAGRQVTARLQERYKDMMANMALLTEAADATMSTRPSTPDTAVPAVSEELATTFARGMTIAAEDHDIKPSIDGSSEPPSSPVGDPTPRRPAHASRVSSGKGRAFALQLRTSASPEMAPVASTSSQPQQPSPLVLRSSTSPPPQENAMPGPSSAHEPYSPHRSPSAHRAPSPRRVQSPRDVPCPQTAALQKDNAQLRAENAQLQATVAEHAQYRMLSNAFAENAKQEREAGREREARHAAESAQLRREAAEREGRLVGEARREAAVRETRHTEERREAAQRETTLRQEAHEREARLIVECRELRAELDAKSQLLAQCGLKLGQELAVSGELRGRVNTLQTRLDDVVKAAGM